MNQSKKTQEPQVLYQGRWVNKSSFRAFVYNEDGQKLANSYAEYESLIGSGLWLPEKLDAPSNNEVKSDGSDG